MRALDGDSFLALPSLSLHQPNRTVKPIYSGVLGSSYWPSQLSLLSTLGTVNPTGSGHRVDRANWGASGCVNALCWEEGGDERLATAGDDTKISIWKPGLDSSTDGEGSTSPRLSFGLSEVMDTGHQANIFDIKFAPSASQLFSCAGDSTVRVYDLSLATNPSLSSITISHPQHPSWTFHENTSACTRVIRCHTSRVKRIATENSPSVFLTCSEDGTVRQHDLRTTHVCRQPGQRSRNEACGPPLVDYGGMSLYSLSVSKLRPHLFVVAGTSPYAYLHDRRMLRAPMIRDWGIEPSESDITQCVRRFGVLKVAGPGEILNHVVATKLSSVHASELLVSYSGAGVYLFDTDDDSYAEKLTADEEDVTEDESFDKSSTIPEKRPREESGSATPGPHLEEAAAAADEEEAGAGEGSEEEEEEEEEVFDRLGRRFRSYHPEVPLIAPRRKFTGHRNETTVKDVNFAFEDAFVVSGSDDGNWFAWDKETAELAGVYKGDNSVVNVLESHPRLPIIAISGIDPTVKLFGPTVDAAKRASLLDKAEEIIARNRSEEGRDRGHIMSAEQMLALLMTRVPPEMRGQVRFALQGEGDDEGEGEAAECTVM